MSDKKISGADELRIIVRNMDSTRESFNDGKTADQLLAIYRAHIACAWDFYPDEWEDRQVEEAIAGKIPRWNDDETPRYE